jgi:hypothetical protein
MPNLLYFLPDLSALYAVGLTFMKSTLGLITSWCHKFVTPLPPKCVTSFMNIYLIFFRILTWKLWKRTWKLYKKRLQLFLQALFILWNFLRNILKLTCPKSWTLANSLNKKAFYFFIWALCSIFCFLWQFCSFLLVFFCNFPTKSLIEEKTWWISALKYCLAFSLSVYF